jgi:hypothetical protein
VLVKPERIVAAESRAKRRIVRESIKGRQRYATNPTLCADRDGDDINHALVPSPSKNANALPLHTRARESTGRLAALLVIGGDGGVVAEEGRPPRAPGVGRRLPPHGRPQARSAPPLLLPDLPPHPLPPIPPDSQPTRS